MHHSLAQPKLSRGYCRIMSSPPNISGCSTTPYHIVLQTFHSIGEETLETLSTSSYCILSVLQINTNKELHSTAG
jgi:hypothetical protein